MNLRLNETLVMSYATALVVSLILLVVGMIAGCAIALIVVYSN